MIPSDLIKMAENETERVRVTEREEKENAREGEGGGRVEWRESSWMLSSWLLWWVNAVVLYGYRHPIVVRSSFIALRLSLARLSSHRAFSFKASRHPLSTSACRSSCPYHAPFSTVCVSRDAGEALSFQSNVIALSAPFLQLSSDATARPRTCRRCDPMWMRALSPKPLKRPGLPNSAATPQSASPFCIHSFVMLIAHRPSSLSLSSPSIVRAMARTIGPYYWKHIVTMTLWLACNFLAPAYLIPALLAWRAQPLLLAAALRLPLCSVRSKCAEGPLCRGHVCARLLSQRHARRPPHPPHLLSQCPLRLPRTSSSNLSNPLGATMPAHSNFSLG